MNIFILLLACIVNAIILIYGQGALGRSDYSVAGMWVLLITAAVTIASVGFIPLQKKSQRLSFNGSEQAWSFSGKTYSFVADGQEWVIVRIGTGFQAGVGRLLPMDGNNSVCMLKKRVRWAAWPHLFSVAYYKEESGDYAKANYPELYSQIKRRFDTGGTYWFEYKYDPKDELDIIGSTHPETSLPLKADDIKADLEIGSLYDAGGDKRNSIIADIVFRLSELKSRTSFATTLLDQRDGVISKTLINAGGALEDINTAKKKR